MDTHSRIIAFLDEHGARYELLSHEPVGEPRAYSAKIGSRLSQQAKALLLRYKKRREDGSAEKGFVVVALPADKRADLEEIKRIIGADELRIAERELLAQATGCAYGELPPMGRVFSLRLLLSKDLLQEDLIYFNAGRLDRSVRMRAQELARIEEATLF